MLARRARGWLLAAALLVPLAQAAADWHTVCPGAAERSHASDPPSFQHTNCDLCLSAAALSGGACPSLALPSPQAPAAHESPQATLHRSRTPPPACHYRSRAPPVA